LTGVVIAFPVLRPVTVTSMVLPDITPCKGERSMKAIKLLLFIVYLPFFLFHSQDIQDFEDVH
jgi:hypothetical protein